MSVSASSSYVRHSVSGPSSCSAVLPFTFRQSKEELIEALRNIKNPFVTKAVTQKFKDLAEEALDPTEEFANAAFFEKLYLAPEIKRLIERLSHEAREYARVGGSLNERVELVRSSFREIGEVMNTTPMWDDLAILLKQPEIQALSSRSLDLVMGSIEGTGRLADVVSILETILESDAFCRFHQRIEDEGDDLLTLVDEIRRNKPSQKVVKDIFSLWDENEAYFKAKTLKLNHPNINMQEPIVECHKTGGGWNFRFDDSGNTKIQVTEDRFAWIHQTYSYGLVQCLTGNPIPQGQQVFVEAGEKELSQLPDGNYTLSMIQDAGGKNRLEVYLSSLAEPRLQYVFACTKHPERGDVIEVNLKQEDRELKIPIDLFYQIQLKVVTNLKIHLDDPARQFTFDEAAPGNSERVKLFQMRSIQEEMAGLQQKLLKDPVLLDQLLDEYFNSRGRSTNLQLIPDEWRLQLMDISYRYSQYLHLDRPLSALVEQVMLAANYVRFVPGRQSMQVRYMMELLRESQKYTRELKGKDLTLFIGNTGAGKSTLVAYLLGAPLKPKENLGGELSFVVSENAERYPTIGQGLGTSQTVFAQGFPIEEGSKTVLCDPPGFNDTRGDEHILCANLTLDQAVKQARSIRSIVLTIPVQAFQVDRGGPVVGLVERVRERFPTILQPRDTHKVAQYVVLTKSGQVQSGVVDAIEDGRRFEALRNEVEQEIRGEAGKESPNMLRIEELERQKGIWQAFLNLHDHQKIDTPNLQNRRRRQTLLKKYTDLTGELDREQYVSAIDTPAMKRQCGETFELSASSWRSSIFEKYINALPETITYYQTAIAHAQVELERLNKERENITDEIETLRRQKQDLEHISSDKSALTEEVQKKLTLLKDDRLKGINLSVQRNEEKIRSLEESVIQLTDMVRQRIFAIREYKKKITTNQLEIDRLSNESVDQGLFEDNPENTGRRTQTGTWKSMNKYLASDDANKNDFMENPGEVDCSERIGDVSHRALKIPNTYRLTPRESGSYWQYVPSLQSLTPYNVLSGLSSRVWDRLNKLNLQSELSADRLMKELGNGAYQPAKQEGRDYVIYDGPYVGSMKKQVGYAYYLFWRDKEALPWLKISHSISGHEYYKTSIDKLRGEIVQLEKKIDDTCAEKNKIEDGLNALLEEQDFTQKMIASDREEKEVFGREIQESFIHDMITGYDRAIAEKEKSRLWLLERRETVHQELDQLQISKATVEKEKKHLAILIHSEWETAKVLRELSELVIGGGSDGESMIQKTSLMECQKFVQFYDEKIKEIEETVWKELNLVG